MPIKLTLSRLVGRGGVKAIAEELNLLPGTVSAALRRASPGHPAVRLALEMAEKSGAIAAAGRLAGFNQVNS